MSSIGTFGDTQLPTELHARVQSELHGGEQLLWVGQPNPRAYRRRTWPIVLFGIPWTGFAVFWVTMASVGIMEADNGPGNAPGGFGWLFSCFPLFGVPFVLIGLGMLSAPFCAGRIARGTCYALTDRRAILWSAGFFGHLTVRSYGPSALNRLQRTERADGTGDLIFEEAITLGNKGTRLTQSRGFFAIDRVREVEELLRKALLQPRPVEGGGGP